MKHLILPLTLSLLAACSSQSDDPDTTATSPTEAAVEAAETPAATPVAGAESKALTLEGLDGLTIGQSVPPGSSFTAGDGQIGNGCETLSSPDWPGVNAMRIDGEVKRISVSDDSDVTLQEGVGPGSSLSEVRAAFPGFRETPHKYWEEGKYLTQPGNDPRLMFEINPEGKVAIMHVGVMPQLAYVEGCA